MPRHVGSATKEDDYGIPRVFANDDRRSTSKRSISEGPITKTILNTSDKRLSAGSTHQSLSHGSQNSRAKGKGPPHDFLPPRAHLSWFSLPFLAAYKPLRLLFVCSQPFLHFHCRLNRLQINLDGGHRTGRDLHRLTTSQTEIVGVDLCLGGQACAPTHHRALTPICDVEGDRFGYSMQGQVPCNFVDLAAEMLDLCALKGDRGILLHGKEAGGTQVGITQLIVGIDAGRIDFSLYPGTSRILLINIHMTSQRVEASFRRAD